VKVLIAGLGSIGQRHARNLRTLRGDTIELLAYRERGLPHVITERMTADADRDVAAHYSIRAMRDLDVALAARPDLVLVCNPTSRHLTVAAAAVDSGCHVLVEKPLADSNDSVETLIASADAAAIVAAVGYQMRLHPVLLRLRQWLAAGAIGTVQTCHARWSEYLPGAHPYEDYRIGYAARSSLGGGVLLSYSHEFDYLMWLFGRPRTIRCSGGRSGALDVDVEDHATAHMLCDVEDRVTPVTVELRFDEPVAERYCRVTGDAGRVEADLMKSELTLRDRADRVRERVTFPDFVRNQLFLDELTQLLHAIEHGGRPVVSLRDGAATLRVALAARESLASGREVRLPW